jgi:crotonobetainyl-CoA:carnitine CoA-transferase CaiB-like acyl-CoA transferase
MGSSPDLPLLGIRVVDAVRGPLAPITRYLAELGARVDRVGACEELADEAALAANFGKFPHDLAIDSAEAALLVERAHVVVADAGQALELAAFRSRRTSLVTMTVSDFGSGNSFSDWQATSPVLHALSAELSRSGISGREPLMPPADLAYQCAAAQGAYALISALYRALRTGDGAHFDFSALDGAVQALDPGFGISGSATLGKPVGLLFRGRPRPGYQYPIFPCADGYVRICLLAKRQWRGMFKWMGEPEQFASPEFDNTANRYKSPDLLPYIGRFFATRNRAELEAGGHAHGVPISGLFTLPEFMASEHLAARGALVDLEVDGKLPGSPFMIDGGRPAAPDQFADLAFPAPSGVSDASPFVGLKVLDLGIIVVGAEQGRLLGDYGADVIKVESLAFPDGNRQSYLDYGMSVSFAAGHRNKRSLGINLRSEAGKALFLDLVRQADVVCSNFKPGTMEKLGLGHDVLAKVNPAIIVSESSAFGDTGPWSERMGYGPLVRAATGLTLAWRYPDDPESFSDPITIYPDHVAGRICAMAAVALLIRRLRTGKGGLSRIAQSEVMLSQFSAEVLASSRGKALPAEPDLPWGVFPAQGDDEWCVVTVRGDDDWQALCRTIGFADGARFTDPTARLANRSAIDAALLGWLAQRSPADAARTLQAAGVPAAPMLRLPDLPEFAYYRERGFYREAGHRWLKETVFAESFVVPSADLPPPPQNDAPLSGEQTHEVIADWLGLDADRIADLVEQAILEPLPAETRNSAERYMARE